MPSVVQRDLKNEVPEVPQGSAMAEGSISRARMKPSLGREPGSMGMALGLNLVWIDHYALLLYECGSLGVFFQKLHLDISQARLLYSDYVKREGIRSQCPQIWI